MGGGGARHEEEAHTRRIGLIRAFALGQNTGAQLPGPPGGCGGLVRAFASACTGLEPGEAAPWPPPRFDFVWEGRGEWREFVEFGADSRPLFLLS